MRRHVDERVERDDYMRCGLGRGARVFVGFRNRCERERDWFVGGQEA